MIDLLMEWLRLVGLMLFFGSAAVVSFGGIFVAVLFVIGRLDEWDRRHSE